MGMALQVSTFAVNYRVRFIRFIFNLNTFVLKGRPFMESLFENRPMLFSVLGSGISVFILASNIMPAFNEKFELVNFSNEVWHYVDYLNGLIDEKCF